MKILILGGTKEAAQLAQSLNAEGHDVTTSLAGRTKEPKPIAGALRIGGFGGAKGLAAFLTDNGFEKLIDATHPFAKQISKNAKAAAEMTGIAFQSLTRPPWKKHRDDHWIEVKDLEEAKAIIPANARVLLALGSQYIDTFKSREDLFFLVRMVDTPSAPLDLPDHKILTGLPSTDAEQEAATLKREVIDTIVCRNSGGEGAYAKIIAARKLGIPVIIVQR